MSDDEDPPPNAADLGLGSDEDDAASNGGPPSNPSGQNFQASSLRQSHLWGRNPPPQQRANRGGGGGGGGGGGAGPAESSGSGPRFERLSAFVMETDLRQSADGGASSLFSEDNTYQRDVLGKDAHGSKKRKGKGKQPKHFKKSKTDASSACGDSEVGDGVERVEASSDDNDEEEDDEPSNEKKRSLAAAALSAAAFGGSSAHHAAHTDDDSDGESLFSTNTEEKRKAQKAAFPIRGVTCIGCAMAHRLGPVEKFVIDNISRMSSDALWKHAALKWKLDVQDPAKKEGNLVPAWSWKDIQAHYLLHCSNPIIARQSTISQLQLMRTTVENRLVRVEEDGTRELDKTSADLMLKIIKQESAERNLLANLLSGGGGASSSGAAGKGGKASGGPTVG